MQTYKILLCCQERQLFDSCSDMLSASLPWPESIPRQVGLCHQSVPAKIATAGSTEPPHLGPAVLEPRTTPGTKKEAHCHLPITTMALRIYMPPSKCGSGEAHLSGGHREELLLIVSLDCTHGRQPNGLDQHEKQTGLQAIDAVLDCYCTSLTHKLGQEPQEARNVFRCLGCLQALEQDLPHLSRKCTFGTTENSIYFHTTIDTIFSIRSVEGGRQLESHQNCGL